MSASCARQQRFSLRVEASGLQAEAFRVMIGGGITGGENMWIKLQACRQKLSGRRLRQWGDSRPKYMGYTWSENYCSGASSFLGEILCRGSDHDERVATMAGEQALSMWRAQKLRMAAAPAIITTTTATTSSHNTSNIHNIFSWAWTTLSSHYNIWEPRAWEFILPLGIGPVVEDHPQKGYRASSRLGPWR